MYMNTKFWLYVVPVDSSSDGICESRTIVLLILSLGVRWR